MKLHFTGDVQALLPGIAALSGDLGFTLSDTGMEVAVRQADGADLTASKADGRSWDSGYVSLHLYAAFPHLHGGHDIRRRHLQGGQPA